VPLPELGWCPWWVAQRIHPLLLLWDQQEHPGGTHRSVISAELSSTQMKSELAAAGVTKSLKKPRAHFPHHHHKLSLPSQVTTSGLLKKPPESLLPVQGEDPNLLRLPIHLLLPVLYLDLPLQSPLQHPQSHLHGGGRSEIVRALTQAHTFLQEKLLGSPTFIQLQLCIFSPAFSANSVDINISSQGTSFAYKKGRILYPR